MRGNERKNLSINRRAIRFTMALRIMIVLLLALWTAFFLGLRLVKIDLPRTVDIIILGSVIAVCALLGLIDIIYSRKKCKCPFCGRPWSMLKYSEFRRGPLDLINNSREYSCYNCKENVDIF